jgi:hypothetical protein
MNDESNGVLVIQKFLPLLPYAYLNEEREGKTFNNVSPNYSMAIMFRIQTFYN